MTDFDKVRMVGGLGRPWGTGGVHHKTFSLYGEFGLTDLSSTYLRVPYIHNTAGVPAAAGAAFDDDTGLGDSQIGFNHLLMKNRERGGRLEGR